jgi:tetratricopeptide (TPR) repeat protein
MNSLIVIIVITVALIGQLIFLLLLRGKLKEKIRPSDFDFGRKERKKLLFSSVYTYMSLIFAISAIGITIFITIWSEFRTSRIAQEVKEANENIKAIERNLGIPIYLDGLPDISSSVSDPFTKGVKFMIEYRWEEAVVEFKQAMKEAKASQLVTLYNLIGSCYNATGKLDLALENYQKSLTLAREFKDRQGEARALGNLGIIYQNLKELNRALEYYKGALMINIEIGDKEGMARELDNLGLIYQARGELDKALIYHNNALSISREITNKEGEASVFKNLGSIYQTRGELDKAFEYYEKALEIDREIGNKKGEASNLNNLGLIYKTKGEKGKALKYFEDALRIFTKIGANREIEMTRGNIRILEKE